MNSSPVKRIAIVTTHPVQYQVPWIRLLSEDSRVEVVTFYCHKLDNKEQGEGFGVEFEWDMPLLEGYNYQFLKNSSKQKSISRFFGCISPEMKEVIRDGNWDAVIINGWIVFSCIQALFWSMRYRIPRFVRGESNSLRKSNLLRQMLHRMLFWCYSGFFAIGESNRRYYLEHGVSEKQITLTPYCVDNKKFTRSDDDKSNTNRSFRERYNIDIDATLFLFCGKFEEKKHPMHILKAFRHIQVETENELPNIHLVMVGDGELKEGCQAFSIREKIPVTYTGFLNQGEISEAYVSSDCLVLPSDYRETWGLVVNEAMASGIPALVSDQVGCQLDLIISGTTGEKYKFGDIQELASLIGRYSKRKSDLKDMGKKAVELINAYDISVVKSGVIDGVFKNG